MFSALFTALIVVGAAIALVPGVPIVGLLVGIQVLNGILLPVVLIFIVRLSSDRGLMAELTNTRLQTISGWATLVLVTLSVALLLISQAFGLG